MDSNNNITQEQLETIERYLNGSMNTVELKEFENKIATNTDLKILVEDVKMMLLGIESSALKAELNNFHEEMNPVRNLSSEKTATTKSLRYRFVQLSIAASIVLAFGIYLFMNQETTSEHLFAKHFTPDPGLPTTMSSTEEFDFYDAMVDYKRGNYAKAIEKWKVLQMKKNNNDTLNFYLGVSYLAEGNAETASKYLSETTKQVNSIFIEDAYHFAALAEIKQENFEKAKQLLLKSKSDKSKILLQELTD